MPNFTPAFERGFSYETRFTTATIAQPIADACPRTTKAIQTLSHRLVSESVGCGHGFTGRLSVRGFQ